MEDEVITVKAASFESLALAEPVPYRLPLAQFGKKRSGFEYWWRLLNFGLELPNPYEFPELRHCDERDALDRYCDAAIELASSACLEYGGSINVSVDRRDDSTQVESITTDFPPAELVRGFLVLFRQFYSNSEPASFARVKSILMTAVRASPAASAETGIDHLRAWGRSHGRLRAYPAMTLVGQRLVREGRLSDFPDYGAPEFLISAFAYGEHLHWGDKRHQVASWRADSFLGPWNEMSFLEAVSGLAYFYMGYAVIVGRAIHRADVLS